MQTMKSIIRVDNYLRNKNKACVFDRCAVDALVYTT